MFASKLCWGKKTDMMELLMAQGLRDVCSPEEPVQIPNTYPAAKNTCNQFRDVVSMDTRHAHDAPAHTLPKHPHT